MPDATLTGAIDHERPENLVEIMNRLADLPEFGMQSYLDGIKAFAEGAARHEELARQERERMREHAARLLRRVRQEWTAAQIEKATGYKV